MTYLGQSLSDGQLPTTKAAILTIAAGQTCIVRSITLFNTNATTQTVNVYVTRNGSTSRQLHRVSLAQYATSELLDGGNMLALSPGDTIDADTNTASAVDYLITGAIE